QGALLLPPLKLFAIIKPDTTFTLFTTAASNTADTTFYSKGTYHRGKDTVFLTIKEYTMEKQTTTGVNLLVSIPINITVDEQNRTLWTIPPIVLLPIAQIILKDVKDLNVLLSQMPDIQLLKIAR
ncbi:MAG: hypothetical protein JW795_11960, partial [Chitinivibrionales bacterium]|nr:hypothetical protein [Chitinivibrionales bacterium]